MGILFLVNISHNVCDLCFIAIEVATASNRGQTAILKRTGRGRIIESVPATTAPRASPILNIVEK